MKLRNYQIDAIADLAMSKLEEVKQAKIDSLEETVESRNIEKLLDSYLKLREEYSRISNEMSKISSELNKVFYFRGSITNKEDSMKLYKTSIIEKEYKFPYYNEIRNKLIIKDLGSDFDVDTFITELVSKYE